jgi:hypothetical protein
MSLPYTINTDVSGGAIVAVLIQPIGEGEIFLISTASGVLNPTEQRYSIAEQENSYWFCPTNFRIYVFEYEVNWYTDNKTRSGTHRCALTSSRISRLIFQLQEYDLCVKHISGARNFLLDTISRNPAGMSEKEINRLTRPRGLVASAVELEDESSVGSKLRDRHIFQARDTKSSEIIRAI